MSLGHIACNPAALQIIVLDEVKERATYFHSLFQEHLAPAIGLLKEKVVNVPCINSSAVKMDKDTELRETANLKCDVCENGHWSVPLPLPADMSNPEEQTLRYYHPCHVDVAIDLGQK